MIKAIVFDFDGTLFHSKGLGLRSLKKVCSETGMTVNAAAYGKLSGMERKNKLKKLFPADFGKVWPAWNKLYAAEFINRATPYNGTIETLQALRSKGFKLFIFSTKREDLILPILKKYGISDLFHDVIGSQRFKRAKPRKKGIVFIKQMHSLSSDEIILVGDSPVDELAAKNAGIEFVFINRKTICKKKVKSFWLKISNINELLNLDCFQAAGTTGAKRK